MKFLERFLYLIYYLMKSNSKQLGSFVNYTSSVSGKSRFKILPDSLHSVFIYNISIKDYYVFRFFEKDQNERINWAGTGFMYEYQLKMNPKSERIILEDKIRFLRHFKPFVKREFKSFNELINLLYDVEKMLTNPTGRLVLKGATGQIGKEVEVINCNCFNSSTLLSYMKTNKYDIAEEFVVQHQDLMALSPSGLNTVRIITQLQDGTVNFLGARLRITVNSAIDNMAAGNLAAPVDLESGVVNGPGVYSDITKEDSPKHPVTGKNIIGFKIPYWKEVLELAQNAALHTPGNRSVGWDIAITQEGPELIEGNHNWCKVLWQLPVKKGLKKELEKYL